MSRSSQFVFLAGIVFIIAAYAAIVEEQPLPLIIAYASLGAANISFGLL